MEEKICQSCAMPMNDPDLYGTEKDASKNEDYCKYCYEAGAFTNPDITMDAMAEICVPFMVESGMKEDESRTIMNQVLPTLKRWKA